MFFPQRGSRRWRRRLPGRHGVYGAARCAGARRRRRHARRGRRCARAARGRHRGRHGLSQYRGDCRLRVDASRVSVCGAVAWRGLVDPIIKVHVGRSGKARICAPTTDGARTKVDATRICLIYPWQSSCSMLPPPRAVERRRVRRGDAALFTADAAARRLREVEKSHCPPQMAVERMRSRPSASLPVRSSSRRPAYRAAQRPRGWRGWRGARTG